MWKHDLNYDEEPHKKFCNKILYQNVSKSPVHGKNNNINTLRVKEACNKSNTHKIHFTRESFDFIIIEHLIAKENLIYMDNLQTIIFK